jgi:hypothetical protein
MPIIDLDQARPSPERRPVSRRAALGSALGAGAALMLTGTAFRSTPSSAVVADAPRPAGSYAGRVSGSALVVLVAVDRAGSALAVVSDHRSVVWLSGSAEAGAFRVRGPHGRMAGRVWLDRFTGWLAVDGTTHVLNLRRTTPPAGLFTTGDPRQVWITLPDGSSHGATPRWPRPGSRAPQQLDRLTVKWGRFAATTHRLLLAAMRG